MTKSVSATALLARVSRSVVRWFSSDEGVPNMLFAYNRWGEWWPFPITDRSEAGDNPNKLSESVRGYQERKTMRALVLVTYASFPEAGVGKKAEKKKRFDGVLVVCWAPGTRGQFTKAARIWRLIEKDGVKALEAVGRADEIKTWLDAPIAGTKAR